MKKNDIYTNTTEIEYLNMDSHIHKNHHQLILMLRGTLHIRVDEKQYFLPERFIGLIPANQIHNLESRNEMVKMLLIYFPSTMPLNKFLLLSSNDFVLENLLFISQRHHHQTKKFHPELYSFSYAFLKMIKTMDNLRAFPLKGIIKTNNQRLQQVIQYIDENYSEQISLEHVAAEYGFSVRNLTRLFKNELITFNYYLNYVRIIRAIEMFTDQKENIEKVGYAVGYNTLSNFSRTFKRFTGQSPKSFIRKNKTTLSSA
ncbi:AraC family transcriptional regulator [Zunongwangia endophytica]|uniref:Helix-turn-helix domain-containing protein n=1 Tax=Zunongwangia endophytica TaxID=1808945 RepID=A0ABV8HE83_9FLAO|nr:AraC family transcriptional regulator [Zunongwangia endophytica]MDN3596736.1 AraC family transcriptional regulator [Zunongwangia endophytica]